MIETGEEDGAVQVPAELVVAESCALLTSEIAAPGVGVQSVVAEVLEDAAVEVGRSALGDEADKAARGAAVLGRVVGAEHLHLRSGINVGRAHAGSVRACTHHRRAVDGLHALLAACAVYVEGIV